MKVLLNGGARIDVVKRRGGATMGIIDWGGQRGAVFGGIVLSDDRMLAAADVL